MEDSETAGQQTPMSEVDGQSSNIVEKGERKMKRAFAAIAIAAVALLVLSSAALASTPPDQKGHEGQPGNQGGYHHAGQQGYEGQPGNQGGK